MHDGGHRKSDLVTSGLKRIVELEWWPRRLFQGGESGSHPGSVASIP